MAVYADGFIFDTKKVVRAWRIDCQLNPRNIPDELLKRLEKRDIPRHIQYFFHPVIETTVHNGEEVLKEISEYKFTLVTETSFDEHAKLIAELIPHAVKFDIEIDYLEVFG